MDEVDTRGICVVGNGHFTKPLGHLINMFDTVIRLSSFRIRDYESLVGTKTDIVSVGRIENLEVEPRLVWVANKSGMYDVPMEIILNHYKNVVFNDENTFLSAYAELGYNKAESHPTLGFQTIFMAIKISKFMWNKPVTICGFDFGHEGWPVHYWSQKNRFIEVEKDVHVLSNERRVVKQMIADGRVQLLNPYDMILFDDKLPPNYEKYLSLMENGERI